MASPESTGRNPSKPLFERIVGEATVSLKCETCGMPGSRRMTYITYIPTFEGRMAGFSKEPDIMYGGISWSGDHSGCIGNYR